MRKSILMALAPVTLFAGLWNLGGDEADYTVLDRAARPFVSAFNADAGKVRLVMYVSPTCGGCLLGAKEMQEKVLATIDDPDLATYVIWAPKNGAQEKHVDKVTGLVTDGRARQYWDEHAAVARPYDERFDLAGPCAGVFVLYGPDARWEDGGPTEPVMWQDAHADQLGREDNPPMDPDALAERVRALLG